MKKLLALLFILAGLTMNAQQNKGVWDNWQKTSCYSKISFRLKYEGKNGEQYKWKVQFRNDFPELISFNYHITDKLGEYNLTTHRKALEAGRTSPEIELFTQEEDIYLLVDKVSLSPYPQDFIDCDHK
ncbi:hypothetical protein OGH69_02620 [Flavobacterium sp. MFBS3-15]|uniref:hypothetical protein n=1 Tax=Flavobacterium sp. MFBS3-15 TaxID=2989816 RepID=UPI00223594F0|nr:hypothetical protein [Flavobacterium sp. MFBS3-15]MCW4467845.1 hypothetical protein [Flavobacterium sp. MFBS3-15]